MHSRFHALASYLKDEFIQPDLLIVERCPFRYANASAARLQQVMGVVQSVWDVPVLFVSPMSWKSWTKEPIFSDMIGMPYVKSDELDAAAMLVTVIGKAKEQTDEQ